MNPIFEIATKFYDRYIKNGKTMNRLVFSSQTPAKNFEVSCKASLKIEGQFAQLWWDPQSRSLFDHYSRKHWKDALSLCPGRMIYETDFSFWRAVSRSNRINICRYWRSVVSKRSLNTRTSSSFCDNWKWCGITNNWRVKNDLLVRELTGQQEWALRRGRKGRGWGEGERRGRIVQMSQHLLRNFPILPLFVVPMDINIIYIMMVRHNAQLQLQHFGFHVLFLEDAHFN